MLSAPRPAAARPNTGSTPETRRNALPAGTTIIDIPNASASSPLNRQIAQATLVIDTGGHNGRKSPNRAATNLHPASLSFRATLGIAGLRTSNSNARASTAGYPGRIADTLSQTGFSKIGRS
jgi:hypothetical protein